MMLLLLDAGNTRTKVAWMCAPYTERHDETELLEHAGVAALATRLAALPTQPERILGSNVAGPQAGADLEEACRRTWGLPIQWCDARHGHRLLHNPYADPSRLGADRWLGMLGLLGRILREPDWEAGTPYLLASFGTATTVDMIHRAPVAGGPDRPAFAGGLILPGATLMGRSLASATAQLPMAEGQVLDFPQETHDAITSGIAAAQGGAVLRQWRLATRLTGRAARLAVCGGGWPLVAHTVGEILRQSAEDLALPYEAPRWLDSPVLDGLAFLARDGQSIAPPGTP